MIDDNLDSYIIDFGISCDDENCNLYGTKGYLSPEFYYHSSIKRPIPLNLAKSSDIFSLGLVFLELLGCTNLFSLNIMINNTEYETTLNNIIEKNLQCLYYKDFSDIINQMLNMNPMKRITLDRLITKLNSIT
jgi:serine/threonine protein kinase